MIIKTGALFQAFKYSIYTLLAVNAVHYLIENFTGSTFTYGEGLGLADIIVAYTDSIDTIAWLILLVMLELETWVIPDENIKGWVDGVMSVVSFLCWIAILYSFYGYAASLNVPLGFEPWAGADPCSLVDGAASFARGLGDYTPLTGDNCALLASGVFYNAGDNMFTNGETLSYMKRLGWLDVLNAGIWVVIVVILELEIYLKSSQLVGTKFFLAYKSFKVFLYLILFVDAGYWLALGDPWGAWDATLWLVAFFFIEMNVLSWQEEKAALRRAGVIE